MVEEKNKKGFIEECTNILKDNDFYNLDIVKGKNGNFSIIAQTKPTNITNVEEASKYLNRYRKKEDATTITQFSNFVSLQALVELLTIAEAWNLMDGFKVDFTDDSQLKYKSYIYVQKNNPNLLAISTDSTTSDMCTHPLLYFKSRERAEQFGKQFKYLFKKYLFNK